MKKIIFTTLLLVAAGVASAQNYILVNSEKVFKSQSDYNNAITTIEKLSETYQAEVDKRFSDIELLYNNYMAQKGSMSAASREANENAILKKEKEATEHQQTIFGNEGTLMKKRVELIQPIQKRIFTAIEAYAKKLGYEMVLDTANNPTILYHNPAIDHTEKIINSLK